MTSASLVVALANARAVRWPTGARGAALRDALADPASAEGLLRPWLDGTIGEKELAELRTLHGALVPVVDALVEGAAPPLDALNALATAEPAILGAERRAGGALRAVSRPARASATGRLLIELVRELGELDPSRLRQCARAECSLVFYDASRSGTQRWHAERPCGVRERQRRHRSRRRS